jgi:hypothetical protein
MSFFGFCLFWLFWLLLLSRTTLNYFFQTGPVAVSSKSKKKQLCAPVWQAMRSF